MVSGSKVRPLVPTSTDRVVFEAEPLSVELAVAVVVSLETPPPYCAPIRGRHRREKVYKDTLIITATQLDEKIMEAKVCM